MILAGDIGGTSARMGLFEVRDGKLELVRAQTYSSREYPSLGKIATEFLVSSPKGIRAACFGIAGPVRNGRVVAPNLAWEADAETLAHELGIPSVKLINDLEANAHGIAALSPADFITLQTGDPAATGNAAVISVGTGLGEAGMYWDGKTHLPFACEGGHSDFAPRNALDCELLIYLHHKFEHVSYERILSGNGQFMIYEFLRDVKGMKETKSVVEDMLSKNPSAVVSNAGLAGKCELCMEALNLYVSFYGSEAGNLALKMMATGGLFIGGGIAPKIIEKLKEPIFLNCFLAKGRMKPLLETVPIRVIMKDTTALLGAARVADRMR